MKKVYIIGAFSLLICTVAYSMTPEEILKEIAYEISIAEASAKNTWSAFEETIQNTTEANLQEQRRNIWHSIDNLKGFQKKIASLKPDRSSAKTVMAVAKAKETIAKFLQDAQERAEAIEQMIADTTAAKKFATIAKKQADIATKTDAILTIIDKAMTRIKKQQKKCDTLQERTLAKVAVKVECEKIAAQLKAATQAQTAKRIELLQKLSGETEPCTAYDVIIPANPADPIIVKAIKSQKSRAL